MAIELRLEQGVFRLLAGNGMELRHPGRPEDFAAFRDWAQRYERALRSESEEALLRIGRDIYRWVETRGFEKMLADDRSICFATGVRPDVDEQAFLDVPWELLADDGGFWAQDVMPSYSPARLLGQAAQPTAAAHSDLLILFMAAAPATGGPELNFEAEEAGILASTKTLPVHLIVEESGALQPLSERVALNAPLEALHLSCHGDIMQDRGAALLLEDEFGDVHPVTAAHLVEGFGDAPPLLVFLSACRTAEHSSASLPLALNLVRSGVPNVVGWDGSVYDQDAIEFANNFYGELAKRRTVPSAAASARRHLWNRKSQNAGGHHWHLARVYVGAQGCGSLSNPEKPVRPRTTVGSSQVFLDKKSRMPVASPEVFVGRRRETQTILREYARDPKYAGVVIHGMGRLGKSSLAARVSSRLPHHQIAVVFGQQPGEYEATYIFNEVVEALYPEQREGLRQMWSAAIRANAQRLNDALQAILTGPAAVHDPGARKRPILLVIDDLERILEPPVAGQRRTHVRSALRDSLRAVIRAFNTVRGQTQSRLLLTSRYVFSLPEGGGTDWADRLFELPLPPLNEQQCKKLQEAEERVAHVPKSRQDEKEHELLARAATASGGNAGLLALLSRPAFEPSTQAQAEAAIAAVECYRFEGKRPAEGDLGQFFVQLALDTYRSALTADEAALMRAALLFSPFPVPWQIMEIAGRAAGVKKPGEAIVRLVWLGCMDAFRGHGRSAQHEQPELAVNELAKPLYDPLADAERQQLAQTVVEPLFAAWATDKGKLNVGPRAHMLFSLACAARTRADIINASGASASRYSADFLHNYVMALKIVEEALSLLDAQSAVADLHMLRIGVECATHLGKTEQAEAMLARGLHSQASDERAMAMLRGALANQMQRRGNLDEALRIRQQEILPVYERLGDVRSRAITMGQIADIFQARGELDEALRIRQQETLPVYERLGDVRERAVTMGRIADIFQARGELDEALRIRQQEELPVYERLGDVHSRAITMGQIAGIFQARGELDEALRIHLDERMPVAQSMHDRDSIMHILYSCALIRLRKGVQNALELQTIMKELSEAYALAASIGQADAIASIGLQLGSLLIQLDRKELAANVLGEAEKACRRLNHPRLIEQIEALLPQVKP